MAGIDRIIERIVSDARSESDTRLDAARTRVEEIRKADTQTAETLRQDLMAKSQQAADNRYERLVGMAHTEARKNMLAAKQEMIDAAFAGAMKSLGAQSEDEKSELLTRLAASASLSGEEELVLEPADHNRFGKDILESANALLKKAGKPNKLRLSAEPRTLEGGGGIVLKDGDIEINCSYGALIASLKDELTPQTAKILFS